MKILLEIHAKFFSLDRITSDDMLFILSIRFDILLSGIIIHSDDDDNDGKCRTACCYFTFLWMPTSLLSSYFHSSHRTHFVAFLDLTYRKEISPRTMRPKKKCWEYYCDQDPFNKLDDMLFLDRVRTLTIHQSQDSVSSSIWSSDWKVVKLISIFLDDKLVAGIGTFPIWYDIMCTVQMRWFAFNSVLYDPQT